MLNEQINYSTNCNWNGPSLAFGSDLKVFIWAWTFPTWLRSDRKKYLSKTFCWEDIYFNQMIGKPMRGRANPIQKNLIKNPRAFSNYVFVFVDLTSFFKFGSVSTIWLVLLSDFVHAMWNLGSMTICPLLDSYFLAHLMKRLYLYIRICKTIHVSMPLH